MCVKERIEGFLRKSGTAETRFGRDAAGDPRLVADLRRGRRFGPEMVARIEAFLRARGG